MKGSSKTIQRVKCRGRAITVFLGLLGAIIFGSSCAYSQSEIDPDHFDSPNTEPIPQPGTVTSKVTEFRYDGTFSLPYSVLCNGKKLAAGQYAISVRFDGKVGHATLNQSGHAIEIARVVPTKASKQHDQIVVVENIKKERTLSLVRVRGFDFAFDPKVSARPLSDPKEREEKVLLTVIVPNGTANQVQSETEAKP